MSLCTGIINLGSYDLCGTIVTGLTATATGLYKIQIQSNESYVEKGFVIGAAINFQNPFNDDATHKFQVLNPSGSVMSLNGVNCFYVKINSRTYRDDSFIDSCLVSGSSGSGSLGDGTRAEFTTNGGGQATVATLIGKINIDLWTYADGSSNVLLGEGDYTFDSLTGAFSGLDNSKKYLAYGF